MLKKRWTRHPPALMLGLALTLAACGRVSLPTPPTLPEIAVTATNKGHFDLGMMTALTVGN